MRPLLLAVPAAIGLILAATYAVVSASLPISAPWLLFLSLFALSAFLAAQLVAHTPPGRSRRFAIRLFAVSALPSAGALGVGSATLVNNWRLDRFAAQILDAPPLREARLVAHSQEVGVLTGNGNHCDFVVRVAYASTLPVDSLRVFYRSQGIAPAVPGGTSAGPPAIDVVTTSRGFDIVLTDAPYEGLLDLRCM